MPIREQDLDESLSRMEAAAFLHISLATFDRIIDQIDHYRVGAGRGRLRVTKRALLDYVNRSSTRAAANQQRKRAS